MILYDGVLSPQNYLQIVTGRCFCLHADNQIEEVENILDYELGVGTCWSYPLKETVEVVKNDNDVVLVEIVNINENCEQERLCRWFEIPDSLTKEEFLKRLNNL